MFFNDSTITALVYHLNADQMWLPPVRIYEADQAFGRDAQAMAAARKLRLDPGVHVFGVMQAPEGHIGLCKVTIHPAPEMTVTALRTIDDL